MVTPEEMRLFALECLRWSDETDNASHRVLMIRLAKTWMNTASAIEQHLSNGGELAPARSQPIVFKNGTARLLPL